MSLILKTTTKSEDAANFVASTVLNKLNSGRQVLLFLTGGSSISVGIKIADILKEQNENLIRNLIITLTDERYGPVRHTDSNWQQLTEKGFTLPQAKLIPILIGDDRDITVRKFNDILNEELIVRGDNRYKIGLFGIGKDGHTAGILPGSKAVSSDELAFGYDTPTFSRITITPKVIEKLDEAVVWAQGEDKWGVVKDLIRNEIKIEKQPAQILKKVPLLTIFSDYSK